MIKVVIVEDQPLTRKALSVIFNSIGLFILFQACNGADLQAFLGETMVFPDIIFMDISMPIINGIEATAFVTDHHPLIKVIALSVFCHEKLIMDMLRNGAKGYLHKSSDPEQFEFAIDVVMNNGMYIPDDIMKEWKIPAEYLKPNNIKKFKTHLLNEREYEFLHYCASDKEYKEIADKMGIQYATLNIYRASVCEKLDIHTRHGLALYAMQNGLNIG